MIIIIMYIIVDEVQSSPAKNLHCLQHLAA